MQYPHAPLCENTNHSPTDAHSFVGGRSHRTGGTSHRTRGTSHRTRGARRKARSSKNSQSAKNHNQPLRKMFNKPQPSKPQPLKQNREQYNAQTSHYGADVGTNLGALNAECEGGPIELQRTLAQGTKDISATVSHSVTSAQNIF